jgi:type I restriction enzyme S subunit
MDMRPGYKLTEVGLIPEDWELRELGELFEITSSKRVFQSEWKAQGIPFYRARELAILGELGVVNNELFITREMYDAFKWQYGVPAVGDMLVTGVGTLGKTYVVSGDHDFYFKDGNIIWFKIGDSLSSEFLRQLYLTPVVIKQIADGSGGTTVGTYTISGAKKTRIPFPPLPEQRAIAEALSDVDALLTGLDRLIAKKRDIKQAAMQQLLTGQTRLPGFQGEWETRILPDLADIRSGGTPSTNDPAAWDGDIAWCTPTDITALAGRKYLGSTARQITAHGLKQSSAEIIPAGSIVMTSRATIGECAINTIPMTTNQGFKNFVPFDSVDAEFLYYLLTTQKSGFISLCGGSTFLEIGKAQLRGYGVRVPTDKAEQTAIANVLSDIDAELAALEARRDKTRSLKQGMMQQLLTGKTRLVKPEAANV